MRCADALTREANLDGAGREHDLRPATGSSAPAGPCARRSPRSSTTATITRPRGPTAGEMRVEPVTDGLRVIAYDGARPSSCCAGCRSAPAHAWYQGSRLAAEDERGLDAVDDHLHVARSPPRAGPGGAVTLLLSTEAAPALDGDAAWGGRAPRGRPARALAERAAAGPRLGGPARPRRRPVRRPPAAAGRARRDVGDRRLSLVRRLGARHHDRAPRAKRWRPGGRTWRAPSSRRSRASWTGACCPTASPTPARCPSTTRWTPPSGTSRRSGPITRRPRTTRC